MNWWLRVFWSFCLGFFFFNYCHILDKVASMLPHKLAYGQYLCLLRSTYDLNRCSNIAFHDDIRSVSIFFFWWLDMCSQRRSDWAPMYFFSSPSPSPFFSLLIEKIQGCLAICFFIYNLILILWISICFIVFLIQFHPSLFGLIGFLYQIWSLFF